MRAIVCRGGGDPESLKLEDVPAPTPKRDEVLIDVKATAIHYADSIMVAGKYQTNPAFPFSPGLETAGTVASWGEGVTRFKPGDRNDWGQLMAAALLGSVPVAIIYSFFIEHYVAGLTGGSVKN